MKLLELLNSFIQIPIIKDNWKLLLIGYFLIIAGIFVFLLSKKIIKREDLQCIATKSLNPSFNFKHKHLLIIGLTLLGLLLNYININLYFGVNVIFGSIISIFIALVFDKRYAIAAGSVISIYSYFLWGHYYAFVIFLFEIIFVTLFSYRFLKRNLILIVSIYWTFIGIPLVFFFYSFGLGLEITSVVTVLLKQSINGVANATFANMLYIILVIKYHRALPDKEETVKLNKIHNAFYQLTTIVVILVVSTIFTNHQIKNVTKKNALMVEVSKERIKETIERKVNIHLNESNYFFVNSLENNALNENEFIDFSKHLFKYYPGTIGMQINSKYGDFSYFGSIDKKSIQFYNIDPDLKFQIGGEYNGEEFFKINQYLMNEESTEIIGNLELFIHKDYLSVEKLKLENFTYYIHDNNGKIIFSSNPDLGFDSIVSNKVIKKKMPFGDYERRISSVENIPYMKEWSTSMLITKSTELMFGGYFLITELPLNDFVLNLRAEIVSVLLATLVLMIFTISLANLFTKFLTKSFQPIINISSEISSVNELGELGEKDWRKSKIYEISNLGKTVEQMYNKIVDQGIKASNIAKEMTDIITNANAIIVGFDQFYKINEWNKNTAKLTGLDQKNALNKDFISDLVHPEDQAMVMDCIDIASGSFTSNNIEFRIKASNSNYILTLMNFTKKSNKDDDSTGWIGIGQDISELADYRSKIEDMVELRTDQLNDSLHDVESARDKIDGILKSIADGLLVCDNYGRVEIMNRHAENMFNVRLSEIVNRDCVNIGLPEEVVSHIKDKKTKLNNDISTKFKLKDPILNKTVAIISTTSLIYDKNEVVQGTITLFRYI